MVKAQIKNQIAQYSIKAKEMFLAVFVPNEANCFLPKALRARYLFWYGAFLLGAKIALISLALILPSTDFFSAIASDRLAGLINQERQDRNLSILALNGGLNSVAGLKVNDMLAKDYFDHTSPAGITPWHWFKQIGYNFAYAGENLAMGFMETDAVFQAWMNSPTHRDNILNPNYQEMGLSVKAGQIQEHADTLAVLVFGKQQASTPKTPAVPKAPVKSNTPTPPPSTSVAPSAAPRGEQSEFYGVSPSPSVLPENQIELQTILGRQLETTPLAGAPAKLGYAPRVLGAFASKSDEIFKSLYLYFTLFLAIALTVNIFVKIRIQYWPTIAAATLIIILSTALIFI